MRKTCKRLQSRYHSHRFRTGSAVRSTASGRPCARFGYVCGIDRGTTQVPLRYHEQPFSWTWYRRGVIYATMHSLFVQLVSSPLPSHKHGLKWYRNVRHTYHLTDSRHLAVPHTTPPRHCCKSPALVLPHTHKWSKWYRCWYQLGRLGGRGGRGSRRPTVLCNSVRGAREEELEHTIYSQ